MYEIADPMWHPIMRIHGSFWIWIWPLPGADETSPPSRRQADGNVLLSVQALIRAIDTYSTAVTALFRLRGQPQGRVQSELQVPRRS